VQTAPVVDLVGCGIPAQSFSSSLEQSELSGATVENDIYFDEATGQLHELVAQITAPSTGTVLTVTVYMDPLPQAEQITPPAVGGSS
jgi:hypothetical protein